jgi:hypothetical protein
MIRQLRVLTVVAAFVLAAGTCAAANTVELTLQVPLKITLPALKGTTSISGLLKPFDVYCAVGSNLGYATGVGAQGSIIGQGSTATAGSKTVFNLDGSLSSSASATVIITYDDGSQSSSSGGAGRPNPVTGYLCWVQWKEPQPTVPPIFVQGPLKVTGSQA